MRGDRKRRRTVRTVAVLGLVVALGVGGWLSGVIRLPGIPSPVGAGGTGGDGGGPGRGGDPVVARLDEIGATLSTALVSYQERARLFANRQLDCPGLARGFVAVDSLTVSYFAAKRLVNSPLDGQRLARDQRISAQMDSVERHFDRSGCPRP